VNNPDENDYTLVRNSYPDYIRTLVWTTEVGKEGTEHIQAYVKLNRQQRMSFIKKLFPKGHFKSITKDEYDINTQRYAQKEDDTTAGLHHISHNDPIPSVDSVLRQICEAIPEEHLECYRHDHRHFLNGAHPSPCECNYPDEWDWEVQIQKPCMKKHIKTLERELVLANPRVAKLLVSPTYTKLKKEWLTEIFLSYIYKQDADDNEISWHQDTGDDATVPTSSVGEEEEICEAEFSETDEGSDAGSEQIDQQED